MHAIAAGRKMAAFMSLVTGVILASALLHALWNAMLKSARDQAAASILIGGGASGASMLLAALTGNLHLPMRGVGYVVLAGLIEGAYFISLSAALRHLPLGTAYGVSRGLGLLLVWPLSMVLMGEVASPADLVGAGLLSTGLFALTSGSPSRRGLIAAFSCALSVAAYPVAYKQALVVGVAPFVLFAASIALAVPMQLVMLGRQRFVRLRAALGDRPASVGLAALLCAASFLLFLNALEQAGAARLTGLRNTSVLFATLLGFWRGDPRTPRALIAAAAITLGAVLLG